MPAPAPAPAPAPGPSLGGFQAGAAASAAQDAAAAAQAKMRAELEQQVKGKPQVLVAKLLFILGMALFASCTFLNKWNAVKARAAQAEIGAIKADYWSKPERPIPPAKPPSPKTAPFDEAFSIYETKELPSGGSTTSEKTDEEALKAEMEAYEKRKTESDKAYFEYRQNDLRDYAIEAYKWELDNYEDEPARKAEVRDLERSVAKYRYAATQSSLGYLVRWLGMAMMFLGTSILAITGEKNEQLVALLIMGLGLIWPIVNLGIVT